jgi:agmatine deiminase
MRPRFTIGCGLVVLLLASAPALAERAKVVPPEVLAAIVDDDPDPLPRSMTPEEAALPLPRPPAVLSAPPVGPVATPSEYSRNAGMLIRWGSFNDVLTAMTVGVTTGDPRAIVHVLVTGPTQQASATTTLSNAGANLSQVDFIHYSANTVWIRDYGPRFIHEGAERAIVDHTYNRPRPLDDAFPAFLANLWGETRYDLPLTHGGGNFHLFDDGEAFMTTLVLAENPGLTAADVEALYEVYQGLDLDIVTPLPSSYDSTQHIDMWLLPVRDREVIIGEYPPTDTVPHAVTEAMATELALRGYLVHRTPGWRAGAHFTYTNSVIVNDLVFACEFTGYPAQNAQALAVYEAAFPRHQVIPVNCSGIIGSAGALHCVVMHVPERPLLLFVDGFESGDTSAWSEVAEP